MCENTIQIAEADQSLTVTVRGQLDRPAALALRDVLDRLPLCKTVLIDLGWVDDMDLSALSVLVAQAIRLRKIGTAFRVNAASGTVHSIIQSTGITDVLQLAKAGR
jgi:anti-anti-sigma factor